MKQREIKFRAWTGEEMIILENSGLQYFDFEGSYSLGFTVDAYPAFWAHEQYNELSKKAREFPIMQFTGLLDKNGNEIYEGDIVSAKWETSSRGGYIQSSDAYVEHEIKCRVIWYYMGFAYERKDGKMTNIPSSASIEVIGNIYENPEIL